MLVQQPSVLTEYKLELAQPPRLIMQTGPGPGYPERQGNISCRHEPLTETHLI